MGQPEFGIAKMNCKYLFFIKIMIRPSIVLMIRQITIMWKFLFRNSVAWFLRFSLNTSLIWTMYFLILELVIARTKSEILTIHWGKLPNTNLRFCILVKMILASNLLFSVLFNFRLNFFYCLAWLGDRKTSNFVIGMHFFAHVLTQKLHYVRRCR